MSASGQSDPRLLLPEWLRDGDLPAAAQPIPEVLSGTPGEDDAHAVDVVAVRTVPVAAAPSTPFSDRLSLDTRLDPGQLVTAADLPGWLGGLERISPSAPTQSVHTDSAGIAIAGTPIDDLEPYLGADAPEERAVDIEVSGWMLVAGAIGLMILILAALKLYLS